MYAKGEARQTNRMCNGNGRWICSCGDHIQMNFTACRGGPVCSLRHTSDCDKCILRGRSAEVISPCKQCKHVAVPVSPSKSFAPPNFSSVSPYWTEVFGEQVIKFGGQDGRETSLSFFNWPLYKLGQVRKPCLHPCWSLANPCNSSRSLIFLFKTQESTKIFYPDSPESDNSSALTLSYNSWIQHLSGTGTQSAVKVSSRQPAVTHRGVLPYSCWSL